MASISIKKNKRGTYDAKIGFPYLGKYKKTTLRNIPTKKEAKEKAEEYIKRKQLDPSMSFDTLLALYLEDKDGTVRGTTHDTKVSVSVKFIEYFGDLPIVEITPILIKKFYKSLQGFKPTYQRKISNELSAIFNH